MGDSPKRSLFELLTKLFIPIIAIAASVYSQKEQGQRNLALGLVGVAVLSLLISLVPKAIAGFIAWRLRRKEQIASAQAFEKLKARVYRFETFMNSGRADSLHQIVFGSLCQCNQATFDGLHLAPPLYFGEVWEQLRDRVDRVAPGFASLYRTVLEFNSLVGNFSKYVVCPLYRALPTKLSPEMLKIYTQQGVQSSLIEYREKYVGFLRDYEDLLKEFDRQLPNPLGLGYYFESPKPLLNGPPNL